MPQYCERGRTLMGSLILLGLLVVIVLGVTAVVVGNYLSQRNNKITKEEKTELRDLRSLLDSIEDLAWEMRDINPELSVHITDMLRTHRKKELG
jgi:hypothetical protein